MPRFRFTVRRMMAAVAIVAVGTAAASFAYEIGQRRVDYLRMAREHDARSRHYLVELIKARRDGYEAPPDVARVMAEKAERMGRLADAEDRLVEKYRRAARYPWLPVAPGPK